MDKQRRHAPLGAEIRMLWGDTLVSHDFLHPEQERHFTVGSAPDVDFIMGDVQPHQTSFQAITWDGRDVQLHFTDAMKGELQAPHQAEKVPLASLISSTQPRRAENSTWTLSLKPGETGRVSLGHLVMEVNLAPQPKAVQRAFFDTIDFRALNIFLILFLFAGAFVIWSFQRSLSELPFSDDMGPSEKARLVSWLSHKPKPRSSERIQKQPKHTVKNENEAAPQPEGSKGNTEAPPKPLHAAPKGKVDVKDKARMWSQQLFSNGKGSLAHILGKNSEGGDMQAAMGNLVGVAPGDSHGLSGLGMKNTGFGGGNDRQTLSIGGIGTRRKGMGDYGMQKIGSPLGTKPSTGLRIEEPPVEEPCARDKELIRQYIHNQRGQIRYCYEKELTRFPDLSGKVSVRFSVNSKGAVTEATIAQSTAQNSALESCITQRVQTWTFPEHRCGTAIVTYPFVLKQAGE